MTESETSISPKTTNNCLQLKLGSCVGCNISTIAIGEVRWRGRKWNDVVKEMRDKWCPKGTQPSFDHEINTEASSGFGQPRAENLESLQDVRPRSKRRG
jgi:hypothetical protein